MGLGVGMTRMNFLQILGTMMAPRASSATAYAIGFLAHSVLAVGFGIVHVGLLHAIGIDSVREAARLGRGDRRRPRGRDPRRHAHVAVDHAPARAHGRYGRARSGHGRVRPYDPGRVPQAHVAFGSVTGAIYAAVVV